MSMIHQEVPCQACDESAPLPPLTDFQKAAALVSEHSTKLAALFASPPALPSAMNCTAAACAMEQAAANLTATYLHISPIYGLALHKEVERCALAILRGVESIITTIISTGTIA
ncbi:hypothetical protein GBAR_LOCUS10234 [Geodia barretti]|uniref:Cyclin-D1-binding protein 1-like N-terminal domain-containing protein n=1 Tax=Geodia barretti TaxID=519541 RepID=A0AA35RS39_GEOBA|nr:hypothetical protein GBAR_LOCUS10234 [Geodia barretti]